VSRFYLSFVLGIIVLCGTPIGASDELTARVNAALQRAGDNAPQLREALQQVPEAQQTGMRFLIAHMPERDLQTLSAQYLLDNVRFAYRAWKEAPWKEQISEEMFLNDVLPYACINERRDRWRADFYRRFQPLVVETTSAGQAAVLLNQKIFPMLEVRFSRGRAKANQSPYETIESGKASCTGLSVLLVAACRAAGVPARFAGTPLWSNRSGNHSWVEIWDGRWQFLGAAEPAGDQLNRAWFTSRAKTAQRDHPLHAIYATSFRRTQTTFPLAWNRKVDDVYAVNVTDRYTNQSHDDKVSVQPTAKSSGMDVEASLHAVAQLRQFLAASSANQPTLDDQEFADIPLTLGDARQATQLLWTDHVERIKLTRAQEMAERRLTTGDLEMPFFYSVAGDKPQDGRSLYISLHGGGGAPKRVNDRQWENQKRLYQVKEGVYVAPRAPTNTWNLWHQGHIDRLFDRLIENMIVFEQVDPNRVYLLGYSAGGDGVYQLAPRMADRFAAAAMMAGHPNEASPLGLRNLPFTIHVGGNDGAYNRNQVARKWGKQLEELRQNDLDGYVHWTKIYQGKGHWLDRQDAKALPWMAQYTRNPLPTRIVWRQDDVTHSRFYWLAVPKGEQRKGVVVRVEREDQHIDVETTDLDRLIIRLNDQMVDLDRDVTVTCRERKRFEGQVDRTIGTIVRTIAERGDPASIFTAAITVELPDKRERSVTR